MITLAAVVIALVFWPITLLVLAVYYWPVTLFLAVICLALYIICSMVVAIGKVFS